MFGLIRGYRSSDNTAQPLRLDKNTNTLIMIDYGHHAVHGGQSFNADFAIDAGGGDNVDILLVTPDSDKYAHFEYEVEAEGEIDFGLYEAATPSNNGTLIQAENRNRNLGIPSTTLVYHTPTIAAGHEGTRMRHRHAGSKKLIGGSDRAVHEIILKRNTKYLIRVKNETGSDNYIAIRLDWYEHADIA